MPSSSIGEKNVAFVVKKHLCASCGTCAGACPNGAIKMHVDKFGVYVPDMEQDQCTNCGLCVRVCPGHGFDYLEQHRRLHGRCEIDASLGPALKAFVGYSTDEEVLQCSQSGGFVSTLLLFCIENALIDGAIVSRWKPDRPLEPETYLARGRRDILAAVGSKYNPVPAGQSLKILLTEPGRFAFVGTSCQIQGMRKAEVAFPHLADKIALYIGLHCLGVFTYHFHDQIVHKLGLKREEVIRFRHRDKAWRGWPCDMRVEDIHGRIHDVDEFESRHWPRPYFTPWRCQLCFDKGNEFADVSCGDCRIRDEIKWFAEQGYELTKGLSEFVIRTERADSIVKAAIKDRRFVVHAVEPDHVTRSLGVAGKKLGLNVFTIVARLWRLRVPDYGVRFVLPPVERSWRWRLLRGWAVVYSSRYYVTFVALRYRPVRWLVKHIPHRWLGWMHGCFRRQVEWVRFGASCALEAVATRRERRTAGQRKAQSCVKV